MGALADSKVTYTTRATLLIVLVMLASPMALMLEPAPGELEGLNPRLNVDFVDGPTASVSVLEGNLNVADYDVDWNGTDQHLTDCTLSGPDAADFVASTVDTDTCRIEFSSEPDFDNPNDDDTDNIYDVFLIAMDNNSDTDTLTLTVTVTDVNDQPPAVIVEPTYSQAESAATAWQTFTIIDTDTTGTYSCWLSGDDEADFSASISGKVCEVEWATAPDYELPTDDGENNVYNINLAFSDGTNYLQAQTTTITVTDVDENGPATTNDPVLHDVLEWGGLGSGSACQIHDRDYAADGSTGTSTTFQMSETQSSNTTCHMGIDLQYDYATISNGTVLKPTNFTIEVDYSMSLATDNCAWVEIVAYNGHVSPGQGTVFGGLGYGGSSGQYWVGDYAYCSNLYPSNSGPLQLPLSPLSIPIPSTSFQSYYDLNSTGFTVEIRVNPFYDPQFNLYISEVVIDPSDECYQDSNCDGYVDDGIHIDSDGDGVWDWFDLCTPNLSGGTITDSDGDGCDDLTEDAFPQDANASLDTDEDGLADFISGIGCCIYQHEGFETGSFSGFNASISTGAYWEVDSGEQRTGQFAAVLNSSGNSLMWDDTDGVLEFTVEGAVEGQFSFWAKYVGEVQANHVNNQIELLRFDPWEGWLQANESLHITSAYTNFTMFSANLTEGNHIFRIIYYNPAGSDFETVCNGFDEGVCPHWVLDDFSVPVLNFRFVPNSTSTTYGTVLDFDDDNDGWEDVVESSGDCGAPTSTVDELDSPPDLDGDFICDLMDPDLDGDGHENALDQFPSDPTEWLDTDGDGTGDNADDDDDGDGWNDNVDFLPLDPTEWLDTDGDLIGDNSDADDDGDGTGDADDPFPLDPSEWLDTDGDGIGDNVDDDDDGDMWGDSEEAACGYDSLDIASMPPDYDGDGICDMLDADDDGDGTDDADDPFPLDPSEWLDTDGDGTGNNADDDDDGDGTDDADDPFPLDPSEWLDTDGDGTGNNADDDDDGDEWLDQDELDCGTNSRSSVSVPRDDDADGVCDILDQDDDNDGVPDEDDECQGTAEDAVGIDSEGCADDQRERTGLLTWLAEEVKPLADRLISWQLVVATAFLIFTLGYFNSTRSKPESFLDIMDQAGVVDNENWSDGPRGSTVTPVGFIDNDGTGEWNKLAARGGLRQDSQWKSRFNDLMREVNATRDKTHQEDNIRACLSLCMRHAVRLCQTDEDPLKIHKGKTLDDMSAKVIIDRINAERKGKKLLRRQWGWEGKRVNLASLLAAYEMASRKNHPDMYPGFEYKQIYAESAGDALNDFIDKLNL